MPSKSRSLSSQGKPNTPRPAARVNAELPGVFPYRDRIPIDLPAQGLGLRPRFEAP
jgi:hypothetical protein